MHLLLALGPSLTVLLAILLVAPFLDLNAIKRLKAKPSAGKKLRMYRSIIISLWLIAALSWIVRDGAVMRVSHAPGDAPWVFGAPWRTWAVAALVALFFLAALQPGIDSILRPRRVPTYTRALKRMSWFLPHDAQQRRWFASLSVTAGVCEEWILRGVVPHALHARVGLSLTAALLISSMLFGWNHLYQGWKAVGITACIGFVFGLLSWLTGGLWLPMLLHAAMDAQLVIAFRPDQLAQDADLAPQ